MIKGKIDFALKVWTSSVTSLVEAKINTKTLNLIQIEVFALFCKRRH